MTQLEAMAKRVHMKSFSDIRGKVYARCGIRINEAHKLTTEWEKVVCKTCLLSKPMAPLHFNYKVGAR